MLLLGKLFQPPDKEELARKYAQVKPTYERLIEEIVFILKKLIAKRKIKVHTVENRIKDFDSFYNKIILKKIRDDPF